MTVAELRAILATLPDDMLLAIEPEDGLTTCVHTEVVPVFREERVWKFSNHTADEAQAAVPCLLIY